MPKASTEADILWPYLLPKIQRALTSTVVSGGGGSGGSGSGVPNPHALNSVYHTGTLSAAQGPLFLLADGTRDLTGDLAVDAGVTIDGVDLSAHVADPDAHHDHATVGNTGLSITGQQLSLNLASNSGMEIVSGLRIDEDADFTWTNTHQFNAAPQINANLNFIGADRTITASDDLTISPVDDLWLNPGGLIMLPDDQEMRSATIADLPTGINGVRLWERSDAVNYWQLTMGAAKFDELYARVFVADEVRIDRGEEYWSKSYGVVETDFVLPALGATVDVWFEDAPALGTANLFSVNDWLLFRTIDWSTGILIMKCWFQVQDAGALDYVSKDTTNKRQQWRLMRKKFGTTGKTIKKGNVGLDAGQVGQGWIHLSALNQDGGPFIQIGDFTSIVSDEPIFTNRTRMGNLNGTVDYAVNTWGFATGNNLGTEPDAGFSGLTSDATNGVRLFNTDLELYDGGDIVVRLSQAGGLELVNDTDLQDHAYTSLSWYDVLGTATGPNTVLTSYADGAGGLTFTVITDGDSALGTIALIANGVAGQSVLSVRSDGLSLSAVGGIEVLGTFRPIADNTYDLGTASLRWRDLYVGTLHATTISGTTIGGAEWENAGSMVIDANAATNTLVSVTNQGAGRADLDVDRNITVGGTVDGVDISIHVADPNAHHNQSHVLATTSALGGDHTVSGLTSGQVLKATSATAASFGVLNHSQLGSIGANDHHNQSHVLATGTALGADHTISGAAVGEVLRALSATTAAFDVLQHGDLGGVTANQHHNQVHGIVSSDHTGTGSALDLVGFSTTNTLGVLTPSSNVGTTPVAALLKSTASGGLTLATLTAMGNLDVLGGGDLTVGSNVLFVDVSQDSVGILRAPDPQFALDVNGPIRGTELVGRHALQLEDVALLLHFDGGAPYESNYTGEPNAIPLGQVPASNANLHFRPGKFYKAAVFGQTGTNLVPNGSFETNTTGWTVFNDVGGDLLGTRVTTAAWYGNACLRLLWTTINNSQYFASPVASASAGSYVFSVWMKAAIPCTVRMQIQNDSTFALIIGSNMSVTEDWQRFDITAGVTAGTPLRINLLPQGAANVVYVDGVQLEFAAQGSWYIDGSLGNGYVWTGTAFASTSTRTVTALTYVLSDMVIHRWSVMGWFCWPYAAAPANNNGAFEIDTSGGGYIELYCNATGIRRGYNIGTPTTGQLFTGSLVPGQWYHIAVTYTPGALNWYMDGILLATDAITFNTPPTVVQLGTRTTARHGDVMIDDFCVSRQTLSAERIRAIFESDAPVFAESSVFSFRATPKGLIWADEEGLWMRNASGDVVLGAYGGDAATKSWAGLTMETGDVILGDAGRGAYMQWDDSLGTLVLGRTGANKAYLYLNGSTLMLRTDNITRFYADNTGLVTINDSGGAAVFTFDASAGAEFTKPLTLGTSGGIYQGTGSFASPTTGLKIWNTSGFGRIGGYNAGTLQWYANTDGKLYAGGGNVVMDASGISLVADTPLVLAPLSADKSVVWKRSGAQISGIGGQYASTFGPSGQNTLVLSATGDIAGRWASIYMSALSSAGAGPTFEIHSISGFDFRGNTSFIGTNNMWQSSTTAAVPVVVLEQSDVSEEFIQFTGTVSAGNPINNTALGAYAGRIRISINGSFFWLPYYS